MYKMPVEKNYFSISPLNDNPLQSSGSNGVSGGFSFKESNPIVKFSLPAIEKLLETGSLVLSLNKVIVMKVLHVKLYLLH